MRTPSWLLLLPASCTLAPPTSPYLERQLANKSQIISKETEQKQLSMKLVNLDSFRLNFQNERETGGGSNLLFTCWKHFFFFFKCWFSALPKSSSEPVQQCRHTTILIPEPLELLSSGLGYMSQYLLNKERRALRFKTPQKNKSEFKTHNPQLASTSAAGLVGTYV